MADIDYPHTLSQRDIPDITIEKKYMLICLQEIITFFPTENELFMLGIVPLDTGRQPI